MNEAPIWWKRPRRVTVVVDNPSWILPYAERLVAEFCASGDHAVLLQRYLDVPEGAVAFYLGCINIAPPEVVARNKRNLVVHESDLPRGRGFSPLSWQILNGESEIAVCLLEAVAEVDAGPVIYRDRVEFAGHELIDDMRDTIGDITMRLCRRFLAEPTPVAGEAQKGTPTVFARRRPTDSRLDPEKSIVDQFELLRIVDNNKYPAWFDYRGHRYRIRIDKVESERGSS